MTGHVPEALHISPLLGPRHPAKSPKPRDRKFEPQASAGRLCVPSDPPGALSPSARNWSRQILHSVGQPQGELGRLPEASRQPPGSGSSLGATGGCGLSCPDGLQRPTWLQLSFKLGRLPGPSPCGIPRPGPCPGLQEPPKTDIEESLSFLPVLRSSPQGAAQLRLPRT